MTLLNVNQSRQFKKDVKRLRHNKSAQDELEAVIAPGGHPLAQQQPLPAKNRDHELVGGEYKGYRECHVRPDLLLVYRVTKSIVTKSMLELYLLRVGTHSELDL